MAEGDIPQGHLPQGHLPQGDTPQVFEKTCLTNHQRYKYIETWIKGSDARWPITAAACNLRYRLDFYGLLGLALIYYADNAATAKYPSLDKHAAEFYKSDVPRDELMRRCMEIGAYTGGTDLDLLFRLYLHEIDLPFWRPGGYYQDRFGERWTAGMKNCDYLSDRTKPRRPPEDQLFESEVNRGDDLEVEDMAEELQAGPMEDQELREPEHQLAQQHHRDPGWWPMVLRSVVWLLHQWLKVLPILMLIGIAILAGWDGLLIAASMFVHAALTGFTIASGVISYLVRVAWSFIQVCWGSVVDYSRPPACPKQTCVLVSG